MQQIPDKIKQVLNKLQDAGFEAYLVGGCVRDLLMGKEPKDWDITTNALPEQIKILFKKSFYNNKFGTVTVLPSKTEITTFRKEAQYTDKRHPDKIEFTNSLKQDLKRRDFTVNAIAFDGKKIINQTKDLENKIIRTVGRPEDRFSEDALRLIRAIRFAMQLDFSIEPKTEKAIKKHFNLLRFVAKERIRDEFIKILESQKPDKGILMLKKLKLLQHIIPELELGIGVAQNKHHIYTVFEHGVLALKNTRPYLELRLAALLHDIAKPYVKEGQGKDATFYNHDFLSAKWAIKILTRLRFSRKTIEKIALLIRNHMFLSDPEKITEAGVRRLIRRVKPENIQDLISLRIADRLGSGVPKARPYRLRYFEYLINKVSKDPISVKMLKINGSEVMQILKIRPCPKIGLLLKALLNEVLDDPKKNNQDYFKKHLIELNKLSETELGPKSQEIEAKKEEIELEEKKKFRV
ncbi:MAG: HD domain-containing protein [bacterium]